jgi:hypothetical protein
VTTSLAAVILAHRDPLHVRRLIGALAGCEVMLHWDAKSSAADLATIRDGNADRITVVPRRDTRLASWSLVAAELAALRLVRQRTDAEHIAVMSGADYPLLDIDRLLARVAWWGERSWLPNEPLPYERWNVRGFSDGGLWRFRHRFPTRRDQIVWVGTKPVFVPWRRAVHPDLEPRASSQWKIYSRADVDRLLTVLDRRADLIRFGRHMFTPDECFIASVLASPRLFGSDRLPTCIDHPWYMLWPTHDRRHPRWLAAGDLPNLRAIAALDAPDSDDKPRAGGEPSHRHPPIFARKFSSRAPEVVDLIEAELHHGNGHVPR